MCIIAAKYFKSHGWVLAKNRDQDYVSRVSFLDEPHKDVDEVMVLYDHDTGYKEGMNHGRFAIATTSLTPNLSDETDKEDGELIERALGMKSQEQAAKYLIQKKLTGFIFIASPEKLILIEAGAKGKNKEGYESKMTIVPKTEIVVRTNHGIQIPWAGFQYGVNEKQDIWRKSSEMRKGLAEKAVKNSTSAESMLECMARKMHDDLQMNQFRVELKPRQMRTIFQWVLIPKESLAIIRPVQCITKVRITKEMISVKVLDNKILKKIYDGKLRHFCKMVPITDNNGHEVEIKTIRTEQFLSFANFLSDKYR